MRILLFLVAFVVAVLATAPLETWLLDAAREPLAAAGAELRVGSLRLAFPAGVRATDVRIETAGADLDIDSLYVGITRSFEADACGGRLSGNFRGGTIALDFDGVDPSRCVRVGKLALESSLSGSLNLDGIDVARLADAGSSIARIDLQSDGGRFSGTLVGAGREGSDVPLGEWEFEQLVLHAVLKKGELEVEEGRTRTSGVEWELLGAKLPAADARSGLRVDFRARAAEDTPRSKALIGLLPRANPDASGWRNYRVSGSLASPRVGAVD